MGLSMKWFGRKKEAVPRGDMYALTYVDTDPTDTRNDAFLYRYPTAEHIHALAVWIRQYGGNGGIDMDTEPRRAFIFIDNERVYLTRGDVIHYTAGTFTVERES